MTDFYSVSTIGEVYVPVDCREAVFARARVKLFVDRELGHLNRIFTHLRHGGVAVAAGRWEQIGVLMDYIQTHKRELLQYSGREEPRSGRGRSVNAALKAATARLMCWADADGNLQAESAPALPFLLELIGESAGANRGKPFLVPFTKVQDIQNALAVRYPVRALNAELVAAENVLAPRSQETIACFQEALQYVWSPDSVRVADIGCGSGCLTLLARQELGAAADLSASDLLPEAVATTRLNLQRLGAAANVLPAGDLFAPFPAEPFDLIIFNAPWVVARVRSRAELAIHDAKQETVKRFFGAAPAFLKPDGRILLGYADASGPKAVANLDRIIAEAGFTAEAVFKKRVATHRSKRKWEQIRVSVLAKKERA